MEEVKESDAYGEAAKEAAKGAYEGAKHLVTHPREALGVIVGSQVTRSRLHV
jgi:hypothetical protein